MLANPEIFKKYIGDRPLTSETIYPDGTVVRQYGELDVELLVKLLLECPYITGSIMRWDKWLERQKN
jgi:hypothetical protein